MSGPYVYTPQAQYQPTPYVDSSRLPGHSPFIPDTTLYPSSPYSNAQQLPSGTPNTPHHSPFPNLPASFDNYHGWTVPPPPPPQRTRKQSWHGVSTAAYSPPAAPPQQLSPYPPGFVGQHGRSRSFGQAAGGVPPHQYMQDTPSPWNNSLLLSPNTAYPSPYPNFAQPPPTPFILHPALNGEAPLDTFFFDLASPTFSPLRAVGMGNSALLTPEELQAPATVPPLTRLHIVCPQIPQWPIDLVYNPAQAASLGLPAAAPPSPVSLGDILVAVHSSMHQRITQNDWASLSANQERAIAKAYSRRCRKAGDKETMERNNGVTRVDYLLDKTRFLGLIREKDDTMRLIVG